MTNATDLIAAERERQVSEEGYTAEHDNGHADQLIRAAKCYAEAGRFLVRHPHPSVFAYRDAPVDADTGEAYWPWHQSYWKPTGDPVRDLVKAAALIAAAIDSLVSEPRASDDSIAGRIQAAAERHGIAGRCPTCRRMPDAHADWCDEPEPDDSGSDHG